MPKFKILFQFSILSCTLTLLVNSLYSHQYLRIAANSTNIHCNNICYDEYNNFNNNFLFEKHWRELRLESFYQTNLSIYRQICLKIYDSCGKAYFPINVHKDSIQNRFKMDYYFDPYINPEEPYYSITTYSEDAPFNHDYYGFYFSNGLLGVQPFFRSDTLWLLWDQVRKTLTEKELYLLEIMSSTGFSLFNDMFQISETLHNEMKLYVKKHLVNEAHLSQDSIKINKGLFLHNIRCDWIDTNSTLQPEKYYSHKNIEKIGNCYGLGIILNCNSTLISEGIYYMTHDQNIYPLIGSIQVYGLNVPVEYLDELLTNNL